jgi:FKBP-type peptidyl-prolyl cis-trans isomerase
MFFLGSRKRQGSPERRPPNMFDNRLLKVGAFAMIIYVIAMDIQGKDVNGQKKSEVTPAVQCNVESTLTSPEEREQLRQIIKFYDEEKKLQIVTTKKVSADLPQVVWGSKVTVYYTALLSDGSVFADHSKEAVEIVLGTTAIPAGLETGLLGMRVGEERQIAIPATLAFDDPNYKGEMYNIPAGSSVGYLVKLVSLDFPAVNTVKTLKTQWYDSKTGEGEAVKQGDVVAVHYSLYNAYGALIGYSATPYVFEVGKSDKVQGYAPAITGMKLGGKRMVILTPDVLATIADISLTGSNLVHLEVEVVATGEQAKLQASAPDEPKEDIAGGIPRDETSPENAPEAQKKP